MSFYGLFVSFSSYDSSYFIKWAFRNEDYNCCCRFYSRLITEHIQFLNMQRKDSSINFLPDLFMLILKKSV